MPSPEKKRKKMEEPSPTQKITTTNPSLPDDLLMSCFARVSRLYYPTLSLASKRFRSLLASPELYKARSLLGRTESCLYVCVQPFRGNEGPTWYTLGLKPNQTLTNHTTQKNQKKEKKSSGYVLVKVPIPDSPRAGPSGLVSVGSDIYNIGSGSGNHKPSSSVWFLDCRSHTWHEAPSMNMELMSLSATVIDRKIYVQGIDVKFLKKKNSFGLFDTRTQIWDPMPPVPRSEAKFSSLYPRSACIDGEFHVRTDEGAFGYSSDQGKWYLAKPSVGHSMLFYSYCEIENVLYSVLDGDLVWCDTKLNTWRPLKGLVGLPKLPTGIFVRMIGYGGKMAVFWEQYRTSNGQKMIWCAVIALERRGNLEIWGEVEWFDHMLTVPKEYDLLEVLVVTL